MTFEYIIRNLIREDRAIVLQKIIESWGAANVITHGEVFFPADLPGFAAFHDKNMIGLLTYKMEGNNCEIITIDSWHEKIGIGSALIQNVVVVARQAGRDRIQLSTTNDNLNALRFYQKLGFQISGINVGAMVKARQLKPQIPQIGNEGIPIRDEILLQLFI